LPSPTDATPFASDVASTRARTTSSGEVAYFPTRTDYLRAGGHDPEAEPSDPAFWEAVFTDWLLTAQSGCQFARRMARRPDPDTWAFVTCPSLGRADLAAADERIEEIGRSAAAIVVLLPSLSSLDGVHTLVAGLDALPRWSYEIVPSVPPDPGSTLIGLRRAVTASSSRSWVLGFVDSDVMPFSRRAPVAALVLSTREECANPHGGVDLAQTELPGVNREALLAASIKTKMSLLAGEFVAASWAAVTFRLPRGMPLP
jgi:hypothetical protein